MANTDASIITEIGGRGRQVADARRAWNEFLSTPLLVILGFLALAVVSSVLDNSAIGWLAPARRFMQRHVFADAQATSQLLGTIAAGLITVTSITFSLLLLAVQQAGSSLTSEVFDQFFRRRVNQVYFGFFVGLALYSLAVLATVDAPFNPVFGATLSLLLTAVALCLLIVLLYTTINQMRPTEIIEAIHRHTLHARTRQQTLIARTRRTAQLLGGTRACIQSERSGYVTDIDADAIGATAAELKRPVEVVLRVSIGSFVAFHDTIADVRTDSSGDMERVITVVRDAIRLERTRDLDRDAAYGIEQMVTIAWTSVSTSKQNPKPGLLVIDNLRDLAARFAALDQSPIELSSPIPVVYTNTVPATLMNAFASLAVVASESLQHQVAAELYRALALVFDRLPPEQQGAIEDVILRSLSALGEHVPTKQLDDALAALIETLTAHGRAATAASVRTARVEFNAAVGHLKSRATRA